MLINQIVLIDPIVLIDLIMLIVLIWATMGLVALYYMTLQCF